VSDTLESVVEAGWQRGLAPDPVLSVDDWANEHRVLSSVASAEPGRWATSRTPYLAAVMESLSAIYRCERVVFMKGAQVGGTEVGLNWLGYVIHHAPGPMLLVQPTVEGAKRVSKQRVAALIESCPELMSRVKDPRSRDSGNTQLMKEFPGGVLIMTGANSAVGLRSMPVRYLFLDEVDGYPFDADGEGDPISLAVQRAATFINRKVYLCSTPTMKGFSRIESAYLESDQRIFEVPCDHCGVHSQINWRDIRWPENERAQAAWHCPHCAGLHPEYRKPALLAGGRWRATAQGDGKTLGFHLSSLYSPWLTWGEIAQEHHASKDDPVRLKVWVNTKLAETWEDREGETLDAQGLMTRRETYGPGVPGEVALLTCGIDVQDDRLELEVIGWGRDEESWSVDYKVLWGDPSTPALWAQLDDYLSTSFAHETLAAGLIIEAACLDTGGHHTLAAYAFCKGKERRRIWAIKGGSGKRPVWPKRPSKANKGKVNLFMVGVDTAKEAIYARLKKVDAGPGTMHFPLDRDAQYFDQLTAERVRTKYVKGFPQRYWWKPDDRRNEALDCRVYGYAALHGLLAMGLSLNKRVEALPPVPVSRVRVVAGAAPITPPMTPSPRRRRMAIASNYM
jgi:phage terminase large subunit GpA-like protein